MATKQPQLSESPFDTGRLSRIALAGLAAIVVAGLVHGKLVQRWGPGDELAAAGESALASFPESFADWRLQHDEGLDPQVLATLECAGHIHRTYVNRSTTEQVSVAVIVGPPGPTAVHTPEICYSGRDYAVREAATKVTLEVDDQQHSLWSLQLQSRRAGAGELCVYYAWATDGNWIASNRPRYEFGGYPYLWKIQVAGAPLRSSANSSSDLCRRFVEDLLNSGWNPSIKAPRVESTNS